MIIAKASYEKGTIDIAPKVIEAELKVLNSKH